MQSQQPFPSSSWRVFNCQSNDEIHQEEQVKVWGPSWHKLTLKQRDLVDKILSTNSSLMNSDSKSLFKPPEKQVSEATGLFLNPVTEAVWSLSIKDEKLTIDVPNFRFQLSPLSSTKFIPVDPLIKLEFEFETPSENQPCLMHIYAKGVKRASFQAL